MIADSTETYLYKAAGSRCADTFAHAINHGGLLLQQQRPKCSGIIDSGGQRLR
jgi:hypothetical protein